MVTCKVPCSQTMPPLAAMARYSLAIHRNNNDLAPSGLAVSKDCGKDADEANQLLHDTREERGASVCANLIPALMRAADRAASERLRPCNRAHSLETDLCKVSQYHR